MIELHAHGKLLLTGEYFVLDGAPALAVPTRLGQSLRAVPAQVPDEKRLSWLALDLHEVSWFRAELVRADWARPQVQSEDPKARLGQILHAAERLSPGCTDKVLGMNVTTKLEFDRAWGLGSSSTLIAAIASWLQVNPYELLERTFGGSGYDLACAFAEGPVLYERAGNQPKVTNLKWHPEWVRQTFFVYLNQKQNSREGIRTYRSKEVSAAARNEIHAITAALISDSPHLRAAAQLLRQHEQVVGQTLGLTPVQKRLFPAFNGTIKSLGAWGGDFVWVLSEDAPEKVRAYFNALGYEVVIAYDDMVL